MSAVLYAESWVNYTSQNSGLISDKVNTLAITPDSLMLFGTDEGLSVFNGIYWKNYTQEDGLIGNVVSDIKIEKTDNLYYVWLSGSRGVTALDKISADSLNVLYQYQTQNSGLVCDTVCALTPDAGPQKWFGTKKGVSVLSNNEWISINTDNYLLSNLINDLAVDKSGLVHIATRGGGVSRIKIDGVDAITSASTIVSTWSWLLSDTVLTVFIDRDDVQWFGCAEGLFRHTGIDSKINWTVYQKTDGLADNCVRAIDQDSAGFLWIGTSAGVSKFADGVFVNYTVQNGLVNGRINDIAADVQGNIWFATDGGVSKLELSNTDVLETNYSPQEFSLGNYPNPFNGGTVLRFTLPMAAEIEMKIYNIAGAVVKKFEKRAYGGGINELYWDAKNSDGKPLSSGVYIASIRFADRIISCKMVMLK